MTRNIRNSTIKALRTAALISLAGPICSGCADTARYDPGAPATTSADTPGDGSGTPAAVLELISPSEGLAVLEQPPAGLVVLDVRTAAEFAAGHLQGAVNFDFYADDFAARLDTLDRAVPYLLYCQSGGRSAQTLSTMGTLGFQEVYEIEGGFGSWSAAGLPVAEE